MNYTGKSQETGEEEKVRLWTEGWEDVLLNKGNNRVRIFKRGVSLANTRVENEIIKNPIWKGVLYVKRRILLKTVVFIVKQGVDTFLR